MNSIQELVLSDAEATFLALEMGKPYFPATPPPTMEPDGWAAVIRGLEARGVLRGHFKLSVADEVAEVLDVVLSADCSLWMHVAFAAAEDGQTRGEILWLKDDAIVRHTIAPNRTMTFTVVDRQAVDDALAAVLDFPTVAQSESGDPQTLSLHDLNDAVDVSIAESPEVAAERFPAAAGYVRALADGRASTFVEYRGPGDVETQEREKLSFTEAPDGLWLVHDDRHVSGHLDGVMTRVQRVTVDMARAEANALVYEDG
jgi:hypothetical protein